MQSQYSGYEPAHEQTLALAVHGVQTRSCAGGAGDEARGCHVHASSGTITRLVWEHRVRNRMSITMRIIMCSSI